MSSKPLDYGRSLAVDDVGAPEVTDAEREAAARVCAQHAVDADDLRHLLGILGILGLTLTSPAAPEKRTRKPPAPNRWDPCAHCGTRFGWRDERGRRPQRFCSHDCVYASRRVPPVPCEVCGAPFRPIFTHSGQRQRYCSAGCRVQARRRA